MLTLPVRIFLAIAVIAYGTFSAARGDQSGYFMWIGAVVLIVGYFRYGAIRPAFRALQKGHFEVARRHLSSIKYPHLLNAQSLAYFHWITAVVIAQDGGDLADAEERMRLAIKGALRTSNDRCIATATLAQIVDHRNNKPVARQILCDAEQISHGPAAAEFLKQLKTEFEDTK